MTTPWPRRWSASTRPSSSVGGGPGGPSTRSSWGPPSGWTGGTSAGFTAPSTTCRRPSTSAGGGSRRKARLPDVVLRPAPPSRRLGGELTSADTALRRGVLASYASPSAPRSGTCSRGSTASSTIVSARQSLPRESKRPSLQKTRGDSDWYRHRLRALDAGPHPLQPAVSALGRAHRYSCTADRDRRLQVHGPIADTGTG